MTQQNLTILSCEHFSTTTLHLNSYCTLYSYLSAVNVYLTLYLLDWIGYVAVFQL